VRKRSKADKQRWLLAAHLTFVWVWTVMGMGGFDTLPTTSKCLAVTDDDDTADECVSVEAVNAWLLLKGPPRILPVWDLRWKKGDNEILG
jgi:hypothetical protein